MSLGWMEEAVCAKEAPEYNQPDHPVRIMRSSLFFFYEGYENDSDIEVSDSTGATTTAKVRDIADDMCVRCPVQWDCLNFAVAREPTGMFAGIYLNKGKIDKTRNRDRTPEEWEALRKRVYGTRPSN